MANMNEQLDCRLSPEDLSILPNPPPTNVRAQGNLLRSHSEKNDTLPKDIRVSQAGETLSRRKLSDGQRFVTTWMMYL